MAVWFGMFLISAMWLFMAPVYVPQSIVWVLFLIPGVLSITLKCRKHAGGEAQGVIMTGTENFWSLRSLISAWPLIPLLAAAVLMPLMWKIATLLLAAGIVSSRYLSNKGYGAGFLISGTIMVFQSAAVEIYWKVAPRLQEEFIFGNIGNFIGKAIGLGSTSSESTVFLSQPTGTAAFLSTWDKFGLFMFLLIFAGSLGILLFFKTKSKLALLRILLVLFIYGALRYTFILAVLTDDGHADIFWSMAMQVSTMVFLPYLLNKAVHLAEIRRQVMNEEVMGTFSRRGYGKAFLTAFIAFVCIFTAASYNEPGIKKGDSVLIDEKHSNWEWTDRIYDTEWYGEQSNYNYYCLYDYLSHYYNMERNYSEISESLLSKYDTIILKTPTEPYEPSEIDSIVNYVNGGGSVFIIGDHTNVFGMGTNLNVLTSKFGFKYNYDSTYDLSKGTLSEYEKPDLLPHPAIQRLPKFLFATSCSIDAPLYTEDIITGYSLKAVDADYSQDNFFPEDGNTLRMRTGLLLQAVGLRYGKGRVAAFSDSTVFSNFWMFMDGKPDLFMGIMEWVNRCNSFPAVCVICAVLGLSALVFMVASMMHMKLSGVITVLYTGILSGGLVSAIVCSSVNIINYPVQKPHTPYTTVAYERQYSDFNLPVSVDEFMAPMDKQLDTFYVWNQRIGLVPSTAVSIKGAVEKGDIIVVTNPKQKISSDDSEKLKAAVSGGKKLLLLGTGKDNMDYYNSFAKIFGIELIPQSIGNRNAYYDEGKVITLTGGAYALKGGIPVITTDNGSEVGCEADYGNGKVIAFSDGELFYSLSLGGLNLIPNSSQAAVGQLEFWIFKRLVGE